MVAASETGVLPERPAADQRRTVRVARPVSVMRAVAIDFACETAADAAYAEVAAHVRFAHLTSNTHFMETTNGASAKSAPVTASSTRLSLACKEAAGQCGSHQESYNMS